MTFVSVAGCKIYRPDFRREVEIRDLASKALRQKFLPGLYEENQEIAEICKHMVLVYGALTDEMIPFLADAASVLWILDQYEQTSLLEKLYKEGKLVSNASKFWLEIGPFYRRTLAYLLERIVMMKQPVDSISSRLSIEDFTKYLDKACISSEKLILFCISSDQNRLSVTGLRFQITEDAESSFIIISANQVLNIQEFQERIDFHRATAFNFYGDSNFENNVSAHGVFLNEPLADLIGVTYETAIGILSFMASCPLTSEDYVAGVNMFDENELFENLSTGFGLRVDSLRKVISGFWMSPENLVSEGRDYWNPQFHYRAHRRGIFRLESANEFNLAWSASMFVEALLFLTKSTCYGHFPKEWCSNNVTNALGKLTVAAGTWFEETVASRLLDIGIIGVCSRTSLGVDNDALFLAAGEVDYLGWSARDSAIVLLECKMIQGGAESRTWKNQINAFLKGTEGKEAFVSKLARKAEYIGENISRVVAALRSEGVGVNSAPIRLVTAFVTFEPSIASSLIDAFPCISLPEFMHDYNAQNSWPYSKGVIGIETAS